jgi:superfamily II DNA or RNA helicase
MVTEFLPFYPELNDVDLQQKIYNKKEFRDLKLKAIERSSPKQLLSHQQIISNFISPHTKYNSLLLFHQTGTGKTCSSIAVSEEIKKVILSETKKYNKTLVFVKNDVLEQNFKRELSTVCGNDEYIVKGVNENDKAYTYRLNKLVGRYYQIVTFEQFLTEIKDKSDEFIKNNYSNRLIIIDEGHFLRMKSHKSEKIVSLYDEMHRFLHIIQNCRVLILTATPIWDKTNEIATLFNLLLPSDKQLPIGAEFDKLFNKSELKESSKKQLLDAFRGRVSFLRSIVSDIKKVEEGTTAPYTKYTTVFPTQVSDFQYKVIKESLEKEKSSEIVAEKVKIIYGKSLDASNFVFPDGTCSTEGFNMHVNAIGKKYILDKETIDKIDGKLDNLKIYSSKFESIIRNAIENPKELIFIYSPIVTGGGAILFGKILEQFGYQYIRSSQGGIAKRKNYSIISSNELTSSSTRQIDNILKQFNNPNNKYGEYIQILIGSEKISHGITLKNVRQVHILTSEWNMPSIDQALGRAYRFESHKSLPESERYIKIYKHVAVHKDDTLIDSYLYRVAEEKDYKNLQIYRLLKEASFDCKLTYDRNVLPQDKDDSRECDYQRCQYSCSKEIEDFSSKEIEENQPIDTNTFDLYYNSSDKSKIIVKLKELFSIQNYIFYSELKTEFNEYTEKTLLDALYQSVNEYISFTNKNGYTCYLKEKNDIYFLSANIDNFNLDDLVYLDNMFFETSNSIKDSEVIESLEYDNKIVKEFCKNCNIKLIEKLHLVSKVYLLENSFSVVQNRCTERIKKHFENSIQYIKKYNVYVHNLYINRSSYNIGTYSKETLKELRVFTPTNKTWNWADKNIINEYHSLLQSEAKEKKIESRFGFFGELSSNGEFRIIDESKKRGVVCTSVHNLLERAIKINVSVENVYQKRDKEYLLSKTKLKDSNFKSNDLKELRLAASLLELSKKEICQLVQDRLRELGLLLEH